jgi:hypothetical protein
MMNELWAAVVHATRVYALTPTADNLTRLQAAELAYRVEVEANMRD